MTSFSYMGSVSHGTMRAEDLIPEFLYVLGQLDKAAHDKIVSEYADVIDADEPDAEQQDYLVEALFDALDTLAPPYCYFGAHEGDGADYGFWLSWDNINDDAQDDGSGSILRLPAGDEWPDLAHDDYSGVEYVLEITDHGNATLYNRDGSEAWGVV